MISQRRASAVFNRARRAIGSPVATAVNPRSEWMSELPAGWTFSRSKDAFLDGTGAVVAVSDVEAYWTTETVRILPKAGASENLNMFAAGVVVTGIVEFYVMPEDSDTISNAWVIIIDGVQYTVRNVNPEPAGNPRWVSVSATRRE